MQTLLKLKPPKLHYLIFNALVGLAVVLLSSVIEVIVIEDVLSVLRMSVGGIIGFLLAVLLIWIYDKKTGFERWSVVLTRDSIAVPEVWFQKKTMLLSHVDEQRTLVYNSENNLRNQIGYTIWSIDGDFIVIRKLLYGRSQVNALLEKIGLPKA